MRRLIVGLIRFYQRWISAAMPPRCRFIPSCSQYMIEAVENHGVVKGMGLTGLRVCKCHPLHAGGFDPVPPASTKTDDVTPNG